MTRTDLNVFKGDSATIKMTITLNGVAVNLAGYSIKFLMKESVRDPDADALLTKTIGSGITVTDAPNGKAECALVPADTASRTSEGYPYAVKIKDSSSREYTVGYGRLGIVTAGADRY